MVVGTPAAASATTVASADTGSVRGSGRSWAPTVPAGWTNDPPVSGLANTSFVDRNAHPSDDHRARAEPLPTITDVGRSSGVRYPLRQRVPADAADSQDPEVIDENRCPRLQHRLPINWLPIDQAMVRGPRVRGQGRCGHFGEMIIAIVDRHTMVTVSAKRRIWVQSRHERLAATSQPSSKTTSLPDPPVTTLAGDVHRVDMFSE